MAKKCPKCQSDNQGTATFCADCGTQLPSIEDIEVTETIEAPKEELTRGTTFAGRYEIIEELGKGGMGRVYRVEDTKLKQEIALKLIKPGIAKDKKTIERFRNELKLARNIRHKNVCGMFDLGETEGAHFITMEYVRGEDLRSLIRRIGQLPIGKSISIAKQLCEGLAEAHRLGVVHRDLKSNNIMIDKEGNVRIMDFGIARSLEAKGITGAGAMIGTPEYMSPEQVEGKEVDQRSDIYSLGVILYEMVAGRVPFEGDTPFTIGMKHKGEMPQNPKEINTQISDDLNRTILKCLEKEKEKRCQSAGEVRSELENIEKGMPTTDRVITERKPFTSKEITVSLGLKKVFTPALVLISIIIIGFVIWRFFLRKEAALTLSGKPSIAVLPFVDMSPQKDQEYLCDGMTDEIIAKLSRLKDWKVIPRTSVMQYKNTNKDILKIGQELDVKTVLEGSVRKEEDNIRVNAKLINIADDTTLWSDTYDQKLEGIFDIQINIAEKITSALETELTPEERSQIIKKQTVNLEAYNFYIKGVDYYYRYTKDSNETAIGLFKKALEHDSNYALAYAGLGNSYAQKSLRFGFPESWLDSALEVALKAISIDPNLPDAYKALGLTYETKGWYRKAKDAYEKAIELNPNHADALSNLSMVSYNLGELNTALKLAKKVLIFPSPAISLTYYRIGRAYLLLNEYEEAENWFNFTIDIEPGITWATMLAHRSLAQINLIRGNHQNARNQAQKILSIDPENILGLHLAGLIELWAGNLAKSEEYYLKGLKLINRVVIRGDEDQGIYFVGLGYVLWKTGRQEESRQMLNQAQQLAAKAIEKGDERLGWPMSLAVISSIQNNKPEAYKWLEKAINAGWRWYPWTLKDPFLENIQNEERFRNLIDRIKAKVDEMRKNVAEE